MEIESHITHEHFHARRKQCPNCTNPNRDYYPGDTIYYDFEAPSEGVCPQCGGMNTNEEFGGWEAVFRFIIRG